SASSIQIGVSFATGLSIRQCGRNACAGSSQSSRSSALVVAASGVSTRTLPCCRYAFAMMRAASLSGSAALVKKSIVVTRWRLSRASRAAIGPRSGHGFLRQEPRREHRHRATGGALLLAFLPGDAGDVEMRPVVLPRKARQEAGGGNAATRAAPDVREIGEI